ncbi:MAG: hypothetical protein RLZZ623_685 [Actinomycetota bacterium]|jgi:Family of unknown function (DUF5719)
MRPQRALSAGALALSLVGLGFSIGTTPVEVDAVFASLGSPTMPFVPSGSFITSTWFCPGVPGGAEGLGGSVSITNPSDAGMNGRITVFTSEPGVAAVEQPVSVAPRSTTVVDIDQVQPLGGFRSAVVEIDGGGGFIEQTAQHPAGNAVAACSNSASSNWYFADGFTAQDSTEQLVLTNPYPDAAIVDIGFVTADGIRNPSRLQGYPVPGRSVQVVELGAKDEAVLAATITATRGRIVAGRSQNYVGGGRTGYTMNLGAPSLSNQYWFADGGIGDGTAEQFSVLNGTGEDVTVSVVYLGLPETTTTFLNDTEIVVPAHRVVTLNSADVAGLPPGRHGAVFSTFAADSVVVERVLTRPAGDAHATTVVMGSPPGLASTRWSASVGSTIPIEDALVVLNADSADATITVSTLGPGGLVPVAGLIDLPLIAGGVITVPFTDPAVLGRPFVVESNRRVYVERLLPRGDEMRGRSGSFALAG